MMEEKPKKRTGIFVSAVAATLGLALFLNLYNIDFSHKYHPDERRKVAFIGSMDLDFYHPILMLQLARITVIAGKPQGHRELVVLCRLVSAFAGVLIVLLLFLISRNRTGPVPALVAAVGLSVSPIMVVHAHYFKEDILFACCAMLTLWAVLRFCREPSVRNALLLGLAAGLGVSAQYKGAILFLLIFLTPIFWRKTNKTAYYAKTPYVLAVSILVFLTVNYPIAAQTGKFFTGLSRELFHAMEGHNVIISPLNHFFSFHLINSIVPGISWPMTALAFAGLLTALLKWRTPRLTDRVFILYFLLFYFGQEASPLKPFPDFARYMIPVIPALFYFIAVLLSETAALWRRPLGRAVVTVFVAGSILFTFYDSFMLDYYLKRDTRAEAEKFVRLSNKKAIFERYASGKRDIGSLAEVDIAAARKKGVELLVASGLKYDRYFVGSKLTGQSEKVYRRKDRYEYLFSFPYKEIRPAHRTYAFSNPVIRIIDISGEKKHTPGGISKDLLPEKGGVR